MKEQGGRAAYWCGAAVAMLAAGLAQASDVPQTRFAGTLVTSGAEPYTEGRFYLQPYLVHTRTGGHYDGQGNRHRLQDRVTDDRLSLSLGYGITERLTGELSVGGGHSRSAGRSSDGIRFADSGVKLLYALRKARPASEQMTFSVMLRQSLPTGTHDRLGDNTLNARGDGSRRRDIALLGQQSLLMPNGHVLRWRWLAGWSPSPSRVDVHGASTYGTAAGFDGWMDLGRRTTASLGVEYSLALQWALALDLTATWHTRETLQGCLGQGTRCQWQRQERGSRRSMVLTPALEYLPSDRVGVLFGAELSLPGSRNTDSFVSPQVSLVVGF